MFRNVGEMKKSPRNIRKKEKEQNRIEWNGKEQRIEYCEAVVHDSNEGRGIAADRNVQQYQNRTDQVLHIHI